MTELRDLTWKEIIHKYLPDSFRPHVSLNTGENEWYTPETFIEAGNIK